MSDNTDDTMRRIEEALDELLLDAMHCGTSEDKPKLLATIRTALQPDAGGWGEDDDRHRANEQAAKLEAWNDVDHDELAQSRNEPVRPYSDVRAELLKPHEFTGRHRSYQELLDDEHDRAVEAWAARFDSAMLSYSHDWGLPDEESYKPFGVAEKHAAIRALLTDGVRLMRRQPKETTDGK